MCRGDATVTVKQARTAAEEEQLEGEAALLAAASHPGVVCLVGVESSPDGRVALVTRTVESVDLGRVRPLAPAEVCGIGAAVATTLADLHGLGITHGAVQADHVLIDVDGRPVLCGFGHGTRSTGDPLAQAIAADVSALAGVLLARLPDTCDRSVRRTLQTAYAGRGRRVPSARAVAQALARSTTGARLPVSLCPNDEVGPDDQVESELEVRENDGPAICRPSVAAPGAQRRTLSLPRASAKNRRRIPVRRLAVTAMTAAAVATVVVALARSGSVPTSPAMAPASPGSPTSCPSVDEGCAALRLSNGILNTPDGRFQLADPGDVVVLGRWTCTAMALPALLRPATGEVWIFDRWATQTTDVAARPLRQVSGAQALQVLPTRSGCDRLEVIRNGAQSPLSLSPAGMS